MAKPWHDRLLASTRGRVLSQMRRGPRTVNELADALGLTDNAVRLHLAGLERDGLIEQQGVRRGIGKPAHVYRLTADADSLFPKPYAAMLAEVLGALRERAGSEEIEDLLRGIGRRTGAQHRSSAPGLRDRVDDAARVLSDLGGLADVVEVDDAFEIRGFSCPLAAVVRDAPETCLLAAELIGGVTGAHVEECCDRAGSPRCSFRVTPARP